MLQSRSACRCSLSEDWQNKLRIIVSKTEEATHGHMVAHLARVDVFLEDESRYKRLEMDEAQLDGITHGVELNDEDPS